MLLSFILAAKVSFVCVPAQVWDGDTFTCMDGTKVRVAGIAAREVRWNGRAIEDAGCSAGHPCPTTSGVAARIALASFLGRSLGIGPHGHVLVRGMPLRCVSNGSGGRERIAAWCTSAAVGDISCRMVRGGHAVRWDRYWREHRC